MKIFRSLMSEIVFQKRKNWKPEIRDGQFGNRLNNCGT